jgi:hypothetical protein
MDLITKLPRTPKGHDPVWVIFDHAIKSAHFLPMRETYSSDRMSKLFVKEIVVKYGVSLSTMSDQDVHPVHVQILEEVSRGYGYEAEHQHRISPSNGWPI